MIKAKAKNVAEKVLTNEKRLENNKFNIKKLHH